jgi:hypothetical protein
MVLSMAAAQGEPVTQAHTDKCARDGHAHWTRDGRDVGVCARCGDVTEAVGPRKDEGAEIMADATGTGRAVLVEWQHTYAGATRVDEVWLIDGYTDETAIPRILAIAHLRGVDAADEVIVHGIW